MGETLTDLRDRYEAFLRNEVRVEWTAQQKVGRGLGCPHSSSRGGTATVQKNARLPPRQKPFPANTQLVVFCSTLAYRDST
jgi:hypothetical protein